MIFGFGQVEIEQQNSIERELFKLAQKHLGEKSILDEEFYQSFKKDFEALEKKLEKDYEVANNSNPRPERYFQFSANGCYTAYCPFAVFVQINFWHINSQHPFSPDGMALMQVKKSYCFDVESLESVKLV